MSTRVTVIWALVFLAGCTFHEELVEPRNPAPASGEFSAAIKPIFERSCSSSDCHSGGVHGFAGGLDLTSYQSLMRGSRYGTVVVSGNPYMSHLVQSINLTDSTLSPISSVSMPASRDPLPSRDIRTIVSWIQRGARADDGSLSFPEPRPLGKVFFTSQAVDLVGILDIQSGLIMRYISVGNPLPFTAPPKAPHNVQVDDQGKYFYVSMISANTLKKYDAATYEFLGEVSVGLSPAQVVLTQDGSMVYVTSFDPNVGQVYKVNTASMTVSNVIAAPSPMKRTHGARLSHDGEYLYVGNNATDFITVIKTSNDSIVTHIKAAADVPDIGSFVYKPYQIAVRSDDRFIYTTCNGRGVVSVIERTGDTFTLVGTIPVGTNPLQCEITRDGRFLYVCNRGSNDVTVIRTDSNTVLTTIPNVGKQPHGVDITDDSRTVYVTCENTAGGDPPHHPLVGSKAPAFISVIDVGSNQVIRRIEVGGFAAGISIYPGLGN